MALCVQMVSLSLQSVDIKAISDLEYVTLFCISLSAIA